MIDTSILMIGHCRGISLLNKNNLKKKVRCVSASIYLLCVFGFMFYVLP